MGTKYIYTALLIISFIQGGFSQTLPTNTEFYKTKELNINLAEFSGSKYLSEKFEKASINDELSNKKLLAFVRYDLLNDVFEVKENLTQSSPSYLKKASATSLNINNATFEYTSYQNQSNSRELGYIQVLGDIHNGKLYAKHLAELRLPQKAKTTLEKDRKGKISQVVYYILVTDDNTKIIDIDKKSIVELFPDSYSSKIKSFLKKTKNKVRNVDDVISVLNFARTL